jgi:hypothetical protein
MTPDGFLSRSHVPGRESPKLTAWMQDASSSPLAASMLSQRRCTAAFSADAGCCGEMMRWPKTSRPPKNEPAPDRKHWFSTSALQEALTFGGCPVCVAAAFSERRGVHAFLREGMMSPQVRQDFLRGSGFCAAHFAMAKDIEEECWKSGGIGMAILCEDIARKAKTTLDQLTQPSARSRRKPNIFEPGHGCIFCEENRRKERALVEVLEEVADEPRFSAPLKVGRLCFRHGQLALELWGDAAKREWLGGIVSEQVAQLAADLRELIRKYDYQLKDEPKGREQHAVAHTAEFLFGSVYR